MTEKKVQSPPSRLIKVIPPDQKIPIMYVIPVVIVATLTIASVWSSSVWLGFFAIVVILCVVVIRTRFKMQYKLWLCELGIGIFGSHVRWEQVLDFHLQVDDRNWRRVEKLVVVVKSPYPYLGTTHRYVFKLDELKVRREHLVAWVHFYRVHLQHGWQPDRFPVPAFPDHSDFYQ